MKREIEFIVKGDYVYFVDRIDEEKYHCISRVDFMKNVSILQPAFKLERPPYNVPDEITIKAFQLDKVDSNQNVDFYGFISKHPVEINFPINRIKWIGIEGTVNY